MTDIQIIMTDIQINGELNNYGICIKKDTINGELLKHLRNYFTVKPKTNNNEIVDNTFSVYYEDNVYIVIPKFFANNHIILNNYLSKNEFNNKVFINITKINYKNKLTYYEFKGSLRDYQNEIINTIIEKFIDADDNNKPKGGIIKLSCGGGKTVLAIYLSQLLKLKTLIIVHQEFLLDQWVERFSQFTNAKIGTIRQKKIDVENKDVVIGMLHSISMINYDPLIFKEFGLVIYDEVHHLGSKMFSKALLKTSAEYTIGLSATPERSDGLMKVINWHIGDILYKMDKKINYRVLVKKIYFRSDSKLFTEKKKWFDGGLKPDPIQMISNLITLESRNKLLINIINCLKGLSRKIFVISPRVEHLELLKNAVDKKIEELGESHIYNTYYYMGRSKKGERKMAEKDGDIIFATLQLAEEGLDISRLDSIVITLPIKKEKTLIQSIGRILRNDTLDVLTQIPLVVDICDILSIYSKWSEKRDIVYSNKKWYLQNYHWNDNNFSYKAIDDKNKNPMNIMFDDILDENFIENQLIIK